MLSKGLAVCGAVTLLWVASSARADDSCQYGGTKYSEGAAICQSGTQFRCDDGHWKSLAIACTEQRAALRECDFGGQSYSAGSTSCQSGNQYRCEDGQWRSLGVVCAGTLSGDQPINPGVTEHSCLYNGQNFGSRATVCQAGVQFKCDNGQWRNMGFGCY